MDELVVGLLAVLVLPVLLVGGLLRWFWRLSKADDLESQLPAARGRGLLAIASVACLVFYGWLDTVTQPMGTPHGPSVSTPRQHHCDTLLWVLLLGAGVVLLLAAQPRRRRAAQCFGAGLLLALGGAGGSWYLRFAQQEQAHKVQLVIYARVQRNDSLQRLPTGFYGRKAGGSATDPRSAEEIPAFPGGEPALRQAIQQRLNYQVLKPQNPGDTVTVVEFIVETDGRITGAHVSEHQNLAGDEESIRVINSLPRYRPGRQNGRPLAIIWHATVPFLRCGAPLNELKP